MFQELAKHLDKVNLVITLSKKDDSDQILYSILPKSKDNKDLGVIPLAGTGTAEELDTELPGIIELAFSGQNAKALANLADFTLSLQKAEDSKSRTAAATAHTTSGSKGATKGSTTPAPEKPKVVNSAILKGTEQKAWKQAQALLQQAVGKTDLDVINYLEKQAEAEAVKVKSQPVAVAEIKNAFAAIRAKLETAKASLANDGLFASATIIDDKKEADKLVNDVQKDAATVSVPALETTPEVPKAAPPKVEKPKAATKMAVTGGSDPFGGSVQITEEDFDDEEEDEELTDVGETETNDSANADEIDIF